MAIPQAYLPRIDFNVDVDKLSSDNALINLLLNNKAQLEFELQMALSAYDNDNAPNPYACCPPYNGYTTPGKYYAIGRAAYLPAPPKVSDADLKHFFDSIRDVKAFVIKLQILSQLPMQTTITSSTETTNATQEKLLTTKRNFRDILFFTLFSSRVTLTDITALRMKYSDTVKVFTVQPNNNHDIKFAGSSKYLFHGTCECNLYPILRYGINAMGHQGVWMSSDINTAWSYARSVNKVILVFEAKPQPSDSRGHPSVYEIAVNRINLKAILWLSRDYSFKPNQVSTEVLQYLRV